MKLRRLILLLALVSVPFLQNVSIAQGDETKIIALENLWNQMQGRSSGHIVPRVTTGQSTVSAWSRRNDYTR